MLSKMKLAILLVLTLQVLSLRLRDRKTQLSSENSVVYLSSYVDPIYYSYTPIYYTYYSSPYYYYYYEPSSYVYPSSTIFTYFRKGEPEQKKEKSPEEIKEEIAKLKKEVWGKSDFETDTIRKNGKAYDSRWLLAQLKITRVLELEDLLAIISRGECAGCGEKAFFGKRTVMTE